MYHPEIGHEPSPSFANLYWTVNILERTVKIERYTGFERGRVLIINRHTFGVSAEDELEAWTLVMKHREGRE